MRPAPIAVYSHRADLDLVLDGLRAPRKHLPNQLLFDARGIELFEELTHAEDYYATRTELELLGEHASPLATQIGPEARVVELACGESTTSARLLRALERPISYIALAATPELLEAHTRAIRTEYPGLEVLPVVSDLSRELELPVPQREWRRTLVYVPGTTIGAMSPGEARMLLSRLARAVGDDRLLLVGADSTRDPSVLLRAYDDESGIAEAFDKNVLASLNRTRGATFDLDAFEHRVVWSAEASRLERQLVSRTRQIVRVGAQVITFAPGEPVVVEHEYKHTPDAMRALLASGGWRARQVFTSPHHPYRLWLCEALTWPQSR